MQLINQIISRLAWIKATSVCARDQRKRGCYYVSNRRRGSMLYVYTKRASLRCDGRMDRSEEVTLLGVVA